jgi:thiamine biosynthesis lipoprotein
MISRRRFLTISACALAAPAKAAPIRWQGRAMGAEATLTLNAPAPLASRAIAIVTRALRHAEAQFSLYQPTSALSRLNATGRLSAPHPDFVALLRQSGHVHHATQGLFDPTVQPLWAALAKGQDTSHAMNLIGWDRVTFNDDEIRLSPGQALTLNGIAQGFVTDQIASRLHGIGLRQVLVNIGEFKAIGGPWPVGVADPKHGLFNETQLTDQAIATSSADATRVGQHSHILSPVGKSKPLWSTVSVLAPNATLADAASTAFILMNKKQIQSSLAQLPRHVRVTLLAQNGQSQHL